MCDKTRRLALMVLPPSVGLCVLIAMTVTSFAADDFWKVKKPSAWTQEEMARMLAQSPWAKRTKLKSAVVVPPRTLSGGEVLQDPKGNLPAGAGGTGVPLPYGDPSLNPAPTLLLSYLSGDPLLLANAVALVEARTPLYNPGANPAAKSVPAPFSEWLIVRWESAEPVRLAKQRLGAKDPDPGKETDFYVLLVIGGPINWAEADENARLRIRESAVLIRKARESVQASDAEFADLGGISVIRLYFSRRIPITAGDKEVLFRMHFGPDLIEVKFDLKEMTYSGTPAL